MNFKLILLLFVLLLTPLMIHDTFAQITSGGFGPTFDGPLSMGYIEAKYSIKETQIFGAVRDKLLPAVIVSLPFVNTNFKR